MEKLKENVELSGSRSSGVAPCQEQMNREEANGSSPLQMTAVDKLEETIMDLLREYRMNAFAHYGVFYHIKGSVSIEYTCMLPFYFPKCKRRRKFSCRQETAGVFFKMAAAICS